MFRLAPLRRSLLRRALLAPRMSVAAPPLPPSMQLLVQKTTGCGIHTTRAHFETIRQSQASANFDDEPDYGTNPMKTAANLAIFMAALLLFIEICDSIADAAPFRMTPSELVKASFTVVVQNELVASRLGDELFAYGDFDGAGEELDYDRVVDSTSLRDECISHAVIELDCGRDRIKATYTTTKIKYNIKGSKGRATVFARVQDDRKNGQYVYLIVTFVETGEVLEIIDNRDELTAPAWEENAVKSQAKKK